MVKSLIEYKICHSAVDSRFSSTTILIKIANHHITFFRKDHDAFGVAELVVGLITIAYPVPLVSEPLVAFHINGGPVSLSEELNDLVFVWN